MTGPRTYHLFSSRLYVRSRGSPRVHRVSFPRSSLTLERMGRTVLSVHDSQFPEDFVEFSLTGFSSTTGTYADSSISVRVRFTLSILFAVGLVCFSH